MKKLRLLSVVCVIALFLTNSLINGVNGDNTVHSIDNDQNEETIVFATPYNFYEYNVYTAGSYPTHQWLSAVYAGLIKRSSANNRGWVPDLAKSMPTISEDGLTFTFELKDDMFFSNGEPLTAEDLEFSLKVAVTPGINLEGYSKYADFLSNNSLSIISTNKVSIKFLKQAPFQYYILNFPIVPQETFGDRYNNCLDGVAADCIWDAKDGSDAISAGPFMVSEVDDFNNGIIVVRNPYYYNSSFVKTDKIIFQTIYEKNAAISGLGDGSIHIIDGRYVPGLTELDGIDGITDEFVADTATQEIAINHKHPWFGTGESINQMNDKIGANYTAAKILRRAMSHLIPRDQYITEFWGDEFAIPAASNMPAGSLGWNSEILSDEYNITTARSIMRSLGFNFTTLGQPDAQTDQYSNFFFDITVLSRTITDPRGSWTLDYVQQLPKIGIGVKEHARTAGLALKARTYGSEIDPPLYDEGGYDIFANGNSWELDWDPSGVFDASGSCSTGSCANFYNFDFEETVSPIAEAVRDYLTELDYDIKLEKVSYVQELIREWLPILPILYPQSHWAWSSDVTNIDLLLISASSQEWDQLYRTGFRCNGEGCERSQNDNGKDSDAPIVPISFVAGLIGLISSVTVITLIRRRDIK